MIFTTKAQITLSELCVLVVNKILTINKHNAS